MRFFGYIRAYLLEVQDEGFPRELHIYDFDGTLFNTPMPDVGKSRWQEATGEKWPHRGWWGQAESLDTDVFDVTPNPGVLAAFHESMAAPNVHTIVLTGRHRALVAVVQKIMGAHGVAPDELKLTPSGLGTLNYKQKVIRKWARTAPLEKIVIYEDRPEHAAAFEAMSDELGIPVEVHKV